MKYIVFEGLDGSGKTTVSKMFVRYLFSKNYTVFYTREPYTTEIETLIRQNQTNKTLLFLFLADRSIHIEKLKNQNVDFIVSDRSFYSTVAYQGYGGGIDIDFVIKLNEFVVDNFLPDVVFYLDCSPDIALSRSKKLDAIENKNLDFFEKVRQGYLDLAKKYNFFTINAQDSLENVFKNVIKCYETIFV
ncbi:MAG: dTMP kinase [Desulfurella sp.]|uniref:dTMP kinase n=1 Tax=Desulfurella sp. TaxID=1962857 RepID=UPI000CAE0442|nr:dTMP kinase [Desulfurella sp.]PMP91734.1 MAG: dTMP kinase [Desulfurella sp.]